MKKTLAFLLALVCASSSAQAPGGSTTPLVIVVGGPPGTPGDTVARAISGPLSVALGQPVVVENRPGAAGTLALAAVARGRSDGQMLGVLALQSAVATSLLKSLPYDTVRDLAPVRQLSSVSNVLVVRTDSPFRSVDDVRHAARGANVTYASGGNATPAHLAGELFRQEAHVQLQHVPFNGPVAGVTAVLGGHVQMMFATAPSVLPLIKAGKLRALATTAPQRLPELLDIPTMSESGFVTVTMRDWHGLVAPAGISAQRLEQISAAAGKALAAEAVQQRLAAAGVEPELQSSPPEFRDLVGNETARWAAILRIGGISVD